jgi:hypothetical protein
MQSGGLTHFQIAAVLPRGVTVPVPLAGAVLPRLTEDRSGAFYSRITDVHSVGVGSTRYAPPSAGAPDPHYEKSGPLQAAPLRFTILPPREALQGLAVQCPGVPPVVAASDHFSCPEIDHDQLAHVFVSNPACVRPVSGSPS